MGNKQNNLRGVTLIELLVVIAIIGLLIAIILPAVQASRERARATHCLNNLRNIGLATTHFEDRYRMLPPARYAGRPGHPKESQFACASDHATWMVRILPFLESKGMYDEWDFSKRYSEHTDEVRVALPAQYVCPNRRQLHEARSYGDTIVIPPPPGSCGCVSPRTVVLPEGAVGDYAGNHGDLSPGSVGAWTDFQWGGNGTGILISSRPECKNGRPIDWLDVVTYADVHDGLSQTILAGEAHIPANGLGKLPYNGPMYDGEDFAASSRVGGQGVALGLGPHDKDSYFVAFGSWHPHFCHFVYGDMSTKAIHNQIDTLVLGALCNRKDSIAVEVKQ